MGMISPVSLTRWLWALWWLILCVTLIGLRGAQIPDETLFMSVSVSVLPEEINIWMGRLSKEDSPWTRGIIQSMETLNRPEGGGKVNLFFLLLLGHPSSPVLGHQRSWFLGLQDSDWDLYHWAPCSQSPLDLDLYQRTPTLRPLDSDWIISLAFLALQLADGRSWDFLASKIPGTNSYNKYPHIYTYSYI